MTAIADLAERLRTARHAIALTGAGISTESGIPDFRSASSGIWSEHDPAKVASLEGFRREPRAFYEFWGERFAGLDRAQPNGGHRALAELERQGKLRALITQNIDGLHQRAGSRRVLEIHGTYSRTRCLGCGATGTLAEAEKRLRAGRLPICDHCGELIKPDVTLFGEDLPPIFLEARRLARASDLVIAMGSSLEVHPAAGLLDDAREAGAGIAIVNRDDTAYDGQAQIVVRGELGPSLLRLSRLLTN
jgi:NAD-dependent deacetylase